jgi:(+)-trans-carveol dehydrogenase/(-)-trans-carveol dehydrogenase
MGRVDSKVAFITGAARGQGRAFAVRLAEEGADIVAFDICGPVATCNYEGATAEDMAETVRLVEKHDRRIVSHRGDVRSQADLDAAVAAGVSQFGHIDIVCANAGISSFAPLHEFTEEQWQTMIDVNLSGAWRALKATAPSMIEAGRGGSIIFTSSVAGMKAYMHCGHYVAAKHGMIGLMRTAANELAAHSIRVNAVLPTSVNTKMFVNDATMALFRPDLENPTLEDAAAAAATLNALPIACVEPEDTAAAVLFLASDDARYITGVALPVDAGALIR